MGGDQVVPAATQRNVHLALPYAGMSRSDITGQHVLVSSPVELEEVLSQTLPKLLVIDMPDAHEAITKLEAKTQDYIALAAEAPIAPRRLAAPEVGGPEVVVSLNITPGVLSGLMAGLVWMIIFFSGVCCLMGVQTNDR